MLTLPIKKKWFDMIKSGEKKEEYREIKPYYSSRFFEIDKTDKNGVKIFENDKCKIIYYDYENGYENSWGDMISEEIEKTIIIDFEFIYTFNFYGEYDEDSLEVIGSKFDSEVKE